MKYSVKTTAATSATTAATASQTPVRASSGVRGVRTRSFIITFLTSIAAVLLFQSVLDDPAGYIGGDGKDDQIYLGAFLDFLLVLANVGTAVVLYPIARRLNRALAIGYVAARIIECVFIAVGIIFARGREPAA